MTDEIRDLNLDRLCLIAEGQSLRMKGDAKDDLKYR